MANSPKTWKGKNRSRQTVSDAREVTEEIPSPLDGERVDRVVSFVADVTRSVAASLIADGAVSIDGRIPSKPSERVQQGAVLKVTVESEPPNLVANPKVQIDTVYMDADVLVVNKPPHMVVHPGSGTENDTLVNGLIAAFPEIESVGQIERPGVVHRLDKGTSGLLMVARTEAAYFSLVQQLSQRSVSRRYKAVVGGLVESEQGLIDAPLGRSTRDATIRAVVNDGRPARTRYEVEHRFQNLGCTLITCQLETGRTHQIRAHLRAIDHPVVGDGRYGGKDFDLGLSRPFLHAAHLGFVHPTSGGELTFDADLPADLQTALDSLHTMEKSAEL